MLGISSDGDSRLLRCMKIRTQFETNPMCLNDYHKYLASNTLFAQDATHIGTKLRNRFLKPSIILPIGNKQVSATHLKILVKDVPKDIHGLTLKDICPDDRQNFKSLEKIMELRVSEALEKYVIDSEATIAYIKICHYVTSSFLDVKLNPLERIFRIWYSVFFLRAWRKWITSTKENEFLLYNVAENFISSNAFESIEINAHCLLSLIVTLKQSNDASLFQTACFDSQPCERTFRQMRSMGTTNYTKINFTLNELLHLIERVELQYDIIYYKLVKSEIIFPRNDRKDESICIFEMPSNEDLFDEIKKAQILALTDLSKFGINVDPIDILHCQMKLRPISEKEISFVQDETVESDDEDISIWNRSEPINLRNYDNDAPNVDADSKYILICEHDGTEKFVRKSSIIWLLSDPTAKLSNDRLKRVQATPIERVSKRTKTQNESTSSTDRLEITKIVLKIGQWGIFWLQPARESSTDLTNDDILRKIVVGSVLGFKYTDGKTEKDKQCRLDSAIISYHPGIRSVDVLAIWYTFDANGMLLPVQKKNNFFISSQQYIATLETPSVVQKDNEKQLSIDVNDLKQKLHLHVHKNETNVENEKND